MKLKLLIASICFPVLLFSQNKTIVPGYLGKRIVVDYTLHFMPALLRAHPGANVSMDDLRDGSISDYPFHINTQHKLRGEYVIAKRWSLTGEFLYSKSQAQINSTLSGSYAPIEFIQMNTFGYIVSARLYRKHLAPISKYVDFKLGYYKVSSNDYTYQFPNTDDAVTIGTVPGVSTNDILIGLGLGNARVIRDRVIFSFGFEFGLLLKGIPMVLSGGSSDQLDYENQDSQQNITVIENAVLERAFLESFLNFSVRIGFMP